MRASRCSTDSSVPRLAPHARYPLKDETTNNRWGQREQRQRTAEHCLGTRTPQTKGSPGGPGAQTTVSWSRDLFLSTFAGPDRWRCVSLSEYRAVAPKAAIKFGIMELFMQRIELAGLEKSGDVDRREVISPGYFGQGELEQYLQCSS